VSIYESENLLIWESYTELILESFKDYVNKKVAEGNDKEEVTTVVAQFKELNDRNKIPKEYGDISKWMKNPFSELKSYLSEIDTTSQKQRKRGNFDVEKMRNDDNVEVVYDDENFLAFAVKNFDGARYYR
jgi:hypothetical protein